MYGTTNDDSTTFIGPFEENNVTISRMLLQGSDASNVDTVSHRAVVPA